MHILNHHGQIDEISSILADNRPLVTDDMRNLWNRRYENAVWTQWVRNRGTGSPVETVVGYAFSLHKMWERTKGAYERLMRQYEDNKD